MGDEHKNPFGGFLFSGSEEALTRLLEAALKEGLRLVPVELGDDIVRLCLPPDHCFSDAAMALVNRSQDGEFGNVSMGLFGGTVQPPH